MHPVRLFDLEESASKISFNSGIKNGGAKVKPKIETANDTFDLDVLHSINPLKAGFADFKFD